MLNNQKSGKTYAEIYDQPDSFRAIHNTLEDIFAVIDRVFTGGHWDELIFTGCGTSLYLAQTAAAMFSSTAGIPARGVPCSELYFTPEMYIANGRNVLILPITRKSYTTEVRMAIERVREFPNVKTLAITCDPDSASYNDYWILSPETAEESVIMTRSFTSMVYLAAVLALRAANRTSEITGMEGYPEFAGTLLRKMDTMAKTIVSEHPELELYITLGQGVYYGVANECMNKMKEMGLTNSEAYYTLEYRHGPMSLAGPNTLVLLLASRNCGDLESKLIGQMKSFGAVTAVIGAEIPDGTEADYSLPLETDYSDLQCAAAIGFIGQFLGYYIAEKKDLDADTPRNLSQAIVL